MVREPRTKAETLRSGTTFLFLISYSLFLILYVTNICFSWHHRCVTHLYGIPLCNLDCLNWDFAGLK